MKNELITIEIDGGVSFNKQIWTIPSFKKLKTTKSLDYKKVLEFVYLVYNPKSIYNQYEEKDRIAAVSLSVGIDDISKNTLVKACIKDYKTFTYSTTIHAINSTKEALHTCIELNDLMNFQLRKKIEDVRGDETETKKISNDDLSVLGEVLKNVTALEKASDTLTKLEEKYLKETGEDKDIRGSQKESAISARMI